MKLIVQIPCYNEENTLPDVMNSIPKTISGVDVIEILVIDDGSTDNTFDVARANGASHIIRNVSNKGLARSFAIGIEEALRQNADIIVNTDGDNQYASADIEKLVQPIVRGEADVVIGDRGGMKNLHFSYFKRCLQVVGSYVIRKITKARAKDAVSGFRALSKDAAKQLNILSEFSYTIEMLIQAANKQLSIVSVPVRSNEKTRESRLFRSIPQFLKMSGITFLRTYTMFRPLRVFSLIAAVEMIIGVIPIVRFLYFYFNGSGDGHIQSLVLGSMLVILGVFTFMVGLVADLISFNRKLVEKCILKATGIEEDIRRLEKNIYDKKSPDQM